MFRRLNSTALNSTALSPLTFDDVRTGRLAVPFGARIKVGRAFYLVYPRERAGMACLVAFRDWILGEIAETNRLMAAVLEPA